MMFHTMRRADMRSRLPASRFAIPGDQPISELNSDAA